MAKVKVLKESELIGGTDNSSVYPITHTKAVFNSNNKELDQILNELEQQITSSTAAQDRALAEAMSNERAARTAADAELQAADKANEDLAKEGISKAESASAMLFAEEAARKAADAELSTSISAEAAARTQRDAELTVALTTETNTRLTADSDEKEARKTADNELSERITSEAATREASDAELTTRISAEESLRAERDEKLRMMGLVTVQNIERLIQLLSPTSMTVEAPKSITITNPERQRIVAKVNGYGQAMPDTYFLNEEWKDVDYISYFRNLANVIFQSDNRAVFVMTDGTIVPLAVGRSLVNIVPTRNTDLAQTVTIDVHEPYLSKVSASSLKLTGSGALRFL